MNLSYFVLGVYVFLQSGNYLDWFSVDRTLLGLVGVVFVVILLLEALWRPIVIKRP